VVVLRAYVASALAAAFLAAVAFVAAGGTELGRTTIAEILVVLVCSGVIVAALWTLVANGAFSPDL